MPRSPGCRWEAVSQPGTAHAPARAPCHAWASEGCPGTLCTTSTAAAAAPRGPTLNATGRLNSSCRSTGLEPRSMPSISCAEGGQRRAAAGRGVYRKEAAWHATTPMLASMGEQPPKLHGCSNACPGLLPWCMAGPAGASGDAHGLVAARLADVGADGGAQLLDIPAMGGWKQGRECRRTRDARARAPSCRGGPCSGPAGPGAGIAARSAHPPANQRSNMPRKAVH